MKSIYELALALTGLTNHHPTRIPPNTNTTLVPVLKSLLKAGEQQPLPKTNSECVYDVVDVTRQLLSNRFIDYYDLLVATYKSSPGALAVTAAGETLLALLTDLDAVLATNDNFLLSNWIRGAR